MRKSDDFLELLQNECHLFYVSVKRWDGKYSNNTATVTANASIVAEDLTTKPRWKLLPAAWGKKTAAIEQSVRAAVSKFSVPFREGVYVVPKVNSENLVTELRRLQAEYKSIVEELKNEWPALVLDLKDRIIREFGLLTWDGIAKVLPTQETLFSRFGVEFGFWPINQGVSFSAVKTATELTKALRSASLIAESLGSTDRERFESIVSLSRELVSFIETKVSRINVDEAPAWLTATQQSSQEMIRNVVGNMLQQPLDDFIEQLANVKRMAENNSVRARSIGILQETYSKLMSFSFLAPQDIVDKLSNFDTFVNSSLTFDSIKAGASARESLKSQLDSISTELQNIRDRSATAVPVRHIEV